jgi:ABC-type transport system involved in multi-copper enzyme maturation permease subunit
MLGPVFTKDLLTLARRRRYFAIRTLFAALSLLLLWLSWDAHLVSTGGDPIRRAAAFAMSFFSSFSFLQIAGVLVLTPAFVGTAIAEDRQRRTMDYLLASRLTNLEIIAGKWFARVLNTLLVLLGGTTVLFVATVFGGIDPDRILMLAMGVGALLLSVSGMATLVSALSRTPQRAFARIYAIVGAFALAPAIALFIAEIVVSGQAAEVGAWYRNDLLPVILEWGAQFHPLAFWSELNTPREQRDFTRIGMTFVAVHSGLGLLLLLVAVLVARRAHLNERSEAARDGLGARWLPRPAVFDRAMIWKEWFLGGGRRPFLILAGRLMLMLLLAAPLVAYLQTQDRARSIEDSRQRTGFALMIANLLLMTMVWLQTAIRAGASFTSERDRDAWISLLSTRLTADEIVHGKFLGAIKPALIAQILFLPGLIGCWICGVVSMMTIATTMVSNLLTSGVVAVICLEQSFRRNSTATALGSGLGILSLLFGVGHLLAALVLSVLSVGVLDGDDFLTKVLLATFILSVPWCSSAIALFSGAGFDYQGERLVPWLTGGVLVAVIDLVLIVSGFRRMISSFPAITGRTEGVLDRHGDQTDEETAPRRESALKTANAAGAT